MIANQMTPVQYKLNLGVVADYVMIGENGKLLLGGEFDTVNTAKLPGAHPGAFVVIRIDADRSPEPKPKISFAFVGPDQAPVLPASPESPADFKFNEAAGAHRAQYIIEFRPLPFKASGRHAFVVKLDGVAVGSIPLFVKHVQGRAQGA